MGTVDDYLEELVPADRDAIDRVYAVARREAPDAEQGKGYGMPALVHAGKPLLSVMRAKKHIGIYPFSPDAVAAVRERWRVIRVSASTRGPSGSSRSIRSPMACSSSWSGRGWRRSTADRSAAQYRQHETDRDGRS